ncbi:MAG: plasmid mobilization relaxosome protein MobC [Ginsengibacter sp.]
MLQLASGVFVTQKLSLLFLPLVAKENLQRIMLSEERKIKHSGGRPTKSVKRDIIKGIRFSEIEYYVVKQKASRAGKNIAAYIRHASLQQKIQRSLNDEERQFVRQLIGMANNLNQLTKKAHQEGLKEIKIMFEQYKKIIDQLLEKLQIK